MPKRRVVFHQPAQRNIPEDHNIQSTIYLKIRKFPDQLKKYQLFFKKGYLSKYQAHFPHYGCMTYVVIALLQVDGPNQYLIHVVTSTTQFLGHVLSALFYVTISRISAVLTTPVPLCVAM
jgi:hypothetical protein